MAESWETRKARSLVKKGAKLLDKEKPNWYKRWRLSLSSLNMESCNTCVLGQNYAADFRRACQKGEADSYLGSPYELAEGMLGVEGSQFGFDSFYDPKAGQWVEYDALQHQWELEIQRRRKADKEKKVKVA